MTSPKVLVLLPLWLLLSAFSMEASPSPSDSPTPPPPSPSPSPSPIPTPTPVNAFISLDVTAGGATTQITVSGGSFNPGEAMSIYWDTPNKVIGSTTADSHGNFSGVKVKPFAGDPPGLHHVCASVQPNPCAQFDLQGPPSPTPTPQASPSESPSPSPSPSESPTPTPVPIPVASNSGGLDVLLHPPFIFLPFLAALGLLGVIAYWFLAASRRRQPSLPAASIVHRSVRPGYGLAQMDIRQAPVGPTPGEQVAPPPGYTAPAEGVEEPPPITES
jgi:hypothetical protein